MASSIEVLTDLELVGGEWAANSPQSGMNQES